MKRHFWQQQLKTKEQSLTSGIAFGHLTTLRLRGNLKASQIPLDIFTEWSLIYLSNMITRFLLNSTGNYSSVSNHQYLQTSVIHQSIDTFERWAQAPNIKCWSSAGNSLLALQLQVSKIHTSIWWKEFSWNRVWEKFYKMRALQLPCKDYSGFHIVWLINYYNEI